jgi:hypothetical protein
MRPEFFPKVPPRPAPLPVLPQEMPVVPQAGNSPRKLQAPVGRKKGMFRKGSEVRDVMLCLVTVLLLEMLLGTFAG